MSKISFSKVESVLSDALLHITVEHLKELGAIANLLSDIKPKVSDQTVEKILDRFRKELVKLKRHDAKLYACLEISQEDEKRFELAKKDLKQEDWMKLKAIRERINELKKILYGQDVLREEDEIKIEEERLKHINKRFNIREGWLPLK